jgi:hypothetical protein
VVAGYKPEYESFCLNRQVIHHYFYKRKVLFLPAKNKHAPLQAPSSHLTYLDYAIGEISSKDLAAEWAMPQLPGEKAALLDNARKAYLGEYTDNWDGLEVEVVSLIDYMKESIEFLIFRAI